jgi:DNA invertase Pin-like site-specific DNA recombinase
MNAAAYVRVSSRAQNAASQRDAIRRAAKARGDVVSAWYEEKKSARTLERPELARLRDDARRGVVRKVYVFRVDRLGRSGIRDMFQVVDELRQGGVELVTLADGFDMTGPAADIVLAVLAWAAKMEGFAIGERVAAARERVRSEGGAWGRPKSLDDETITKIAAARLAGASIRTIARNYKIPRSTVHEYVGRDRRRPSRKGIPRGTPDSPGDRGGQ